MVYIFFLVVGLIFSSEIDLPICDDAGFEALRIADTTKRENDGDSKFNWVPKINAEAMAKVCFSLFGRNYDAYFQIKNLTTPVSIIGIVGRARTGKSYFLHNIVHRGIFGCVPRQKSQYFSVGSTTESHTRGMPEDISS